MKRKVVLILVILMLISVCLISSGCANRIKYGSWLLSKSVNLDTGEEAEPPFNMIFDVSPNGEVYFMESLYGTVTTDRNEFVWKSESGASDCTGAWKIEGYTLYMYMDDQPVMLVLDSVQNKAK